MAQNVLLGYFIDVEALVAPWSMSLFAHVVPLEFSEILWTLVFEKQWTAFVAMLYGIFKTLGDRILEAKNLKTFMDVFKLLNKPKTAHEYSISSNGHEQDIEVDQ